MAHLRVLVFLLVWECIAAKYVIPHPPWFTHDIPQKEFGERKIFPSGNSDKRVSEQTSLEEIKRLFESLDQISARSHVSADQADGPVAWYEPQQDEPLYDDGKCVDRFSGDCQLYADNYQCWEEQFKTWMQAKCRKTCRFCKENCWDSKYGCCPDEKTTAEGPNKAGCGVTLCVDLRDCEKIKDQCDNVSISSYDKKWLRNNCAYTCRLCKAPNPKADCEAQEPLYGCCWNGDEATGWNGKGCIPCEDVYVRACRLFPHCDSPFYNVRKFVNLHCPMTCGRCGECVDKQETSKCEGWARQGLCTSPREWRAYMEENCGKTCRFCESSESVLGVRSLLGL